MTDLEKLKAIKTAYKKCFESDDGKKVLGDLTKRCFAKQSTFTGEALTMAYNEGTRSILLHINSMIDFTNLKNDVTHTESNAGNQEG